MVRKKPLQRGAKAEKEKMVLASAQEKRSLYKALYDETWEAFSGRNKAQIQSEQGILLRWMNKARPEKKAELAVRIKALEDLLSGKPAVTAVKKRPAIQEGTRPFMNRRSFLQKTGKLNPRPRFAVDASLPNKPYVNPYRNILYRFYDKSEEELNKERKRLRSLLEKTKPLTEKKALQWQITALDYLQNARQGREPASFWAKILTEIGRHPVITPEVIRRRWALPDFVTNHFFESLAKDANVPDELAEKVAKVKKKAYEVGAGMRRGKSMKRTIQTLINENPQNVNELAKLSGLANQTVRRRLKELNDSPYGISDLLLKEQVTRILARPNIAGKPTRFAMDETIMWTFKDKDTTTIQQEIDRLGEKLKEVESSKLRKFKEKINGLIALKQAKENGPKAPAKARLILFLAEHPVATYDFVSEKTGVALATVRNQLGKFAGNPNLPKELKKRVAKYAQRSHEVYVGKLSGPTKRDVLKYIMKHEPKSRSKIEKETRGNIAQVRKFVFGWLFGPHPIRNAQKGPGVNVEAQVGRLRSNRVSKRFGPMVAQTKWAFSGQSIAQIEQQMNVLQKQLGGRLKAGKKEEIYEQLNALADMKEAKGGKATASHEAKIMNYLRKNPHLPTAARIIRATGVGQGSANLILKKFRYDANTPDEIAKRLRVTNVPKRHRQAVRTTQWAYAGKSIQALEKKRDEFLTRAKSEHNKDKKESLMERFYALTDLKDAMEGRRRASQRARIMAYLNQKSSLSTIKKMCKELGISYGSGCIIVQSLGKEATTPKNMLERLNSFSQAKRPLTYLLSNEEKLEIIFSPEINEKIRQYSQSMTGYKYAVEAQTYVEEYLLGQLDRLPSMEDMDWFIPTRIVYGCLQFRRMKRKKIGAFSAHESQAFKKFKRQHLQGIEEESHASKVEREVMRLLAKEEAEEKKKKEG